MKGRKHGGWHKHPATATTGFSSTTVIPKSLAPPKESWWTRAVHSRQEFDELAAARSREAGWVGKTREGR